jgi:hypothetical protein
VRRHYGDRVRAFSRHRVPSIVEAMLSLRASSVTINGAAVVSDPLA